MSKSISVCAGFLTGGELPLLNLALHALCRIGCIERVVVLDTTRDRPAEEVSEKVLLYGRDYGSGFNLPTSKGGFHEVDARNDLLRRMRSVAQIHRCNWLLLSDPDELFLPNIIGIIGLADKVGKESAMIECWHACNLGQHIVFRDKIRMNNAEPMYDPHPRAIRLAADYDFVRQHSAAHLHNDTQHCVLPVDMTQSLIHRNCCHIHVRHMLKHAAGYKAHPEAFPVMPDWPETYRRAFRLGWMQQDGMESPYYPLPLDDIAIRH